MSVIRGVALHGALFGVASVLALYVWTRDEKPKTSTDEQIEVWGGRMDDLTSVTYETDKLRVQLEPRKDSFGRWYTVTLEKTVDAPPPSPTRPHGGAPPGPTAAPPPHRSLSLPAATLAEPMPANKPSAKPSASSPPKRARSSRRCWRR